MLCLNNSYNTNFIELIIFNATLELNPGCWTVNGQGESQKSETFLPFRCIRSLNKAVWRCGVGGAVGGTDLCFVFIGNYLLAETLCSLHRKSVGLLSIVYVYFKSLHVLKYKY